MSKYKLEFTLKQHTPLIHFQHDQDGATLRATELKPKLDRFLIQKLGLTETIRENNKGKEVPKEEFKHWFINDGKEHLALDYKVRIDTKKKPKEIEIKKGRNYKLPNFFGNMGDEYESKYLNYMHEDINLTIKSFIPRLLTQIEQNIEDFFIIHNFGTRQSKGFGSFTLKKTALEKILPKFNLYFKTSSILFNNDFLSRYNDLFFDPWKAFLELFFIIEIFYKNLRSGINRKNRNGETSFYIKPGIFSYTMDILEKQWDKKSIKEYYLKDELKDQARTHGNPDILTFSDNGNPHILIKDIFGLATSEDWMSYRAQVKKIHPEIERFPSPLLFKPVQTDNGFIVGIINHPVHNEFLDKTFDIKFNGSGDLQLKTPRTFDWKSFWEYYQNHLMNINRRASSEDNIKNQFEYEILTGIHNNNLTFNP